MNVLLVDDNPIDRFLTAHAFEESTLAHHLSIVEDGPQALAFLKSEAPHHDAPRPDVVLLDVNMPGMNGLEVVRRIREDPAIADIVVLLLVGSALDIERFERRELQVDGYLRKPVDIDDMLGVLRTVERS